MILQSKIYNYSKEELIDIINNSDTMSAVLTKVGLAARGSNHKTLKRRCLKEGIDLDDLKLRTLEYYKKRTTIIAKDINDILVENSNYNPVHLKKRLLKTGVLDNICSECGISPEWNQKPLTLIMDHINGIHSDNRIENLRILCPNCHSQTPTYTGRNANRASLKITTCKLCDELISNKTQTHICVTCAAKKRRKVERPSKEELEKLLETYSMVALGKKYGVSDRAVRKWLKYYEIFLNKNI